MVLMERANSHSRSLRNYQFLGLRCGDSLSSLIDKHARDLTPRKYGGASSPLLPQWQLLQLSGRQPHSSPREAWPSVDSIAPYFDKKMRPSLFESSDRTSRGQRSSSRRKDLRAHLRSVSHFLNGPQRYRTSNAEKIPARRTYIIIGMSLDILILIFSSSPWAADFFSPERQRERPKLYGTAAFMYLLGDHLILIINHTRS